jgi:hypothetical protein
MSRTQKGSKGAGYEYWTARPGNKGSITPSSAAKKRTHKAERQQNKVKLTDGSSD